MAAGHAGLQLSFGSTGDCFDQRRDGDLLGDPKREIAHIRGASGIWFETSHAAGAYQLFEFIEVFYIRQRPQAGLGQLIPAEYAVRLRERP
jgi:hypothetical protein